MKNSLVMVIVFILICVVPASASINDIDLDSYTEDELVTLLDMINDKLSEIDPFYESIVYPSKYIVGIDIEPGTYVFQVVEGFDYDKDNGPTYAILDVRNEEEQIDSKMLHIGEYWQVKLEVDQVLTLNYLPCQVIRRT